MLFSYLCDCIFNYKDVYTFLGKEKRHMITAEMLTPITETLTANLNVLVPIGITIMGTMIGIGLIPRIVYKIL